MGKKTTTLQIDEGLHKKAKERGIPFGKTLEDALKTLLDEDVKLGELEAEKRRLKNKINEINREIRDINETKKKIEEELGKRDERMEKALRLCEKFYNKGEITDEEFRRAAEKFHVDIFDLRKRWEVKFL